MTNKPAPPKTFSLSKEEQDLLLSQANLRSQYMYLASLIERDTFIYVNTEVRKRLGVGPEMTLDLQLAEGKVIATPKPEPLSPDKK